MRTTQVSTAWAVAQAAESLAAAATIEAREAGRALRCCEVVGLDRLEPGERERYTQGVRVWLRFYDQDDLDIVRSHRSNIARHIAQAFGIGAGAVQLDLGLLSEDENWLGVVRRYQRGGDGHRLDRYFTDDVIARLKAKGAPSPRTTLTDSPAEVRILLRRLRYRLGDNFGSPTPERRYGFWTTPTTDLWAQQSQHSLEYLVHFLSHWSSDLKDGHADQSESLSMGYWGEVDTEADPLVVGELTTRTGSTADDVRAVLDHAGSQVRLMTAQVDGKTDPAEPIAFFIEEMERLLRAPERLKELDVLLIHRGGGIDGREEFKDHAGKTRYKSVPVSEARKNQLLELCVAIRDHGVEVVVSLGHADTSLLRPVGSSPLPLGVFEATTPTAGAAWILQEHVNPHLIDTALIFGQP